ncbi:hypothetical protein OUZ56_026778 [Daphnia magna]|uniref:MIF4G domain-containing protein n=1 Tax=Daphnia magna TaxID=35525 RepID=A0ABQ9ZMS3_9CRUS|nr:hypothetical protein OUZ56_026778 [Daphnia magna]
MAFKELILYFLPTWIFGSADPTAADKVRSQPDGQSTHKSNKKETQTSNQKETQTSNQKSTQQEFSTSQTTCPISKACQHLPNERDKRVNKTDAAPSQNINDDVEEITQLQQQVFEITMARDNLQEENEKLRNDLSYREKEHQEQLENLKCQRILLEDKTTQLLAQKDQELENTRKLQPFHDALHKEISKLRSDLKQKTEKYQKEFEKLRQRYALLNQKRTQALALKDLQLERARTFLSDQDRLIKQMQEEIVQLRKSNKELTGKLAKIEANSSPAGQIHQEQIKEPEVAVFAPPSIQRQDIEAEPNTLPVTKTTRRVYDRRALMELKDSVGTTNIKSLLYFGILRDSHSEKSTPTNQGVEFMTRSYHPLFPAMEHGQPRKREIRLMSSQEEPRKANNPNVWIPKRLSAKSEDGNKTSSEEILRTIRGILNKLTPSNYQRLLAKIQETNIDSQDCLAGVIRIFFAKAVEESIFASIYANMCLALSTKDVASSSNPAETINFRKLILSHCQREFEKDSAGLVKTEQKRLEFENAETETEKHKLQEELKELVDKNRRTSFGNIIFIGELFKVNVISSNVMHQCIRKLLSHKEDEDSIECLCKLLTTVGKQLESSTLPDNGVRPNFTNAQIMTSYIQTLQTIAGERKVSSRIRFMIQDVVDLRKTGWKPRRAENGPRTIEEIHKEINQELEGQQKQLPVPQKQGKILKESRPVKQVKDTINNRTPKVPTSQARIQGSGSMKPNVNSNPFQLLADECEKSVDKQLPPVENDEQEGIAFTEIKKFFADEKAKKTKNPVPNLDCKVKGDMKEKLLDQEEQQPPLPCPKNTQKGKPSNARTNVPVNTRAQTVNPNSVSTPNFKIVTAQIKMETFPDKTKVGESVRRDYNFTISGNDAENRKAAAKDLLDGLPVRLECPDLTLDGVDNLKIKQMNKELSVEINRPSSPTGKVTIYGKINNCKLAYEQLTSIGK